MPLRRTEWGLGRHRTGDGCVCATGGPHELFTNGKQNNPPVPRGIIVGKYLLVEVVEKVVRLLVIGENDILIHPCIPFVIPNQHLSHLLIDCYYLVFHRRG